MWLTIIIISVTLLLIATCLFLSRKKNRGIEISLHIFYVLVGVLIVFFAIAFIDECLVKGNWHLSVGAAIIGSILMFISGIWTKMRDVKTKAIVDERQKWREKIREDLCVVLSGCNKDGSLSENENENRNRKIAAAIDLRTRVNPNKDDKIIKELDKFLSSAGIIESNITGNTSADEPIETANTSAGEPIEIEKNSAKILLDECGMLLKHDWERAKIETSIVPWRASDKAKMICDK
jgi:hypothetical protein